MKYLLSFLFFYNSFTIESQVDNYYEIMYTSSSMTLNTYKKPKQAFMSLYVHGESSIYQWESERNLDSIRAKREIEIKDLRRYYSREKYAIEITENSLKYYDVLGSVEYQYKEEISFNWKLEAQTKKIRGYTCKKASVSYGGRKWVAWYAIDIPINAGPYKFKGLPGLIIKMTDRTNSYDFELISIQTKKHLPLKKLFHRKERVIVERTKYNIIRFKYNSLTFKERMNLLNTERGVTTELEFTSADGNNPFKNLRNVDRSKKNNFIEIDHNK